MTFPFGESVTLVRRAVSGKDAVGNDTSTPTNVPLANVGWDPGTSSETVQGGDTVVQQPRFFLPAGTVVQPTDAILRTNGNRYEIVGEPGDYASPFTGWAPGVVVNVRRVTG